MLIALNRKRNGHKHPKVLNVFEHSIKVLSSEDIRKTLNVYSDNLSVIDSYNVCIDSLGIACAKVSIYIDKSKGIGFYIIDEPSLNSDLYRVYVKLKEYLYITLSTLDSQNDYRLFSRFKSALKELDINVSEDSVEKLWYYIVRESKYSELTVPMSDENIEDIELCHWDKPVTVVHRNYSDSIVPGALITNIIFSSMDKVKRLIMRFALRSHKNISIVNPRLHAMLPEGFRVSASIGVVSESPVFNVRRFPLKPLSITKLIKDSMISSLLASYVWILNDTKKFYMVIGASGTGKTTLLNAFLMLSHPLYKIVVIEDVPEIVLPRNRVVKFYSNENTSLFELAIDALRYRPDIIVVGEVRGREIEALIRAIASGSGSASTFHASTPEEVLMALRNLLPQDLFTMFTINMGSLIFVSKVYHKKLKHYVRRVVAVYEYGEDGWKRIFYWDPELDEILPNDPWDIVKRSELLKKASIILGSAHDDLANIVNERRKFLDELIQRNQLDYDEVTLSLYRFYARYWGA